MGIDKRHDIEGGFWLNTILWLGSLEFEFCQLLEIDGLPHTRTRALEEEYSASQMIEKVLDKKSES